MKLKYVLTSLAAAAAIGMTGCGSNGSSDGVNVASLPVFVDDVVDGVTYDCGQDTAKYGTLTHDGGHFGICPSGSNVTFSIGNLILGTAPYATDADDGVFFVTDLVGTTRDDIDNPEVLKIAQVLQSLDSDGDPKNGITINSKLAADVINEDVEKGTKLSEIDNLDQGIITVVGKMNAKDSNNKSKYVDSSDAEEHLAESKENIDNGKYKPDVTGAN